MGKLVGAVALCCIAVVLSVAVLVSAVLGGSAPGLGAPSKVSAATARTGPALPAGWAALDQAAAATCPGLPWMVLAAIGTVESGSGRSTAPGVASGANAAGAEGPMPFEPSTFAAYATVDPGVHVRPTPTTRWTPCIPPPPCSAPTVQEARQARSGRPCSPTTTTTRT